MLTDKTYLTTNEAAEYTGYAPATLEKLRCHGKGPAYLRPPGGRRVMYLRDDLDAWLLAGRRESTSA